MSLLILLFLSLALGNKISSHHITSHFSLGHFEKISFVYNNVIILENAKSREREKFIPKKSAKTAFLGET
jgi:hypothetical protein